MPIENLEQKMLAYALKNAVEHEGKCQSGAVLNPLFHEGLERDKVKDVMPKINEIVKRVNSMTLEEQEKELEEAEKLISHRKERVGLPELEDVPATGIITRFSPSSSASAFHIGHILTGMPSSLYVKKYGGKLYLRIEDTNPEKTVPECYESFPKEAEWIFGNITEHYAQSDRMLVYYKFAEELIGKGFAFVCTCVKEEETEESNEPEVHKIREPCKCRNNSVKDNQEKWKKMLDSKGFKEGEAVLRFKTSLDSKNQALIDFPLARINLAKHPHVGNKYRIWPLMNLCVTYDDIEQKCTHIIRAKEHRDNALRQAMIFDALKIKLPHTYFLGRYKFTDLEISKTKITERIKKGEFTGWDDIRLPLARNFKKRGYRPEAFAKMVEQRGLSEVDKVMTQKDFFAVLNNFNREIIKLISTEVEFSEKKSKDTPNAYTLLMDDALEKKIYTKEKLENEKIYFLKDVGFAKLNDKTLWFCHS
ncbi:MAG: glutamate--tRNA ligase family protein [archaeon]